MTTLNNILKSADQIKRATEVGKTVHRRLQHISTVDGVLVGDETLVARIMSRPELCCLFDSLSRAEVPVAGTVFGRFVSRRIDRLRIDEASQTIDILDYKTDTDKTVFYDKYMAQVREYIELLKRIYPKYRVRGYILWTHDFELEQVT